MIINYNDDPIEAILRWVHNLRENADVSALSVWVVLRLARHYQKLWKGFKMDPRLEDFLALNQIFATTTCPYLLPLLKENEAETLRVRKCFY
jgi:hypothetical protein